MLVDFKDLKATTRRVMKYLDHQNLNEIKPFDIEMNPSSEHLAGFIPHRVSEEISDDRVKVYKVRVWETPSSMRNLSSDLTPAERDRSMGIYAVTTQASAPALDRVPRPPTT